MKVTSSYCALPQKSSCGCNRTCTIAWNILHPLLPVKQAEGRASWLDLGSLQVTHALTEHSLLCGSATAGTIMPPMCFWLSTPVFHSLGLQEHSFVTLTTSRAVLEKQLLNETRTVPSSWTVYSCCRGSARHDTSGQLVPSCTMNFVCWLVCWDAQRLCLPHAHAGGSASTSINQVLSHSFTEMKLSIPEANRRFNCRHLECICFSSHVLDFSVRQVSRKV